MATFIGSMIEARKTEHFNQSINHVHQCTTPLCPSCSLPCTWCTYCYQLHGSHCSLDGMLRGQNKTFTFLEFSALQRVFMLLGEWVGGWMDGWMDGWLARGLKLTRTLVGADSVDAVLVRRTPQLEVRCLTFVHI